MKKIISMLLASALAVSAMVPVMAKDTFSDVKDGHWAKEYVEDMAAKGLISGYDDGTYRPGTDVSRMDAFALFARLMGSNNEANEEVLEVAVDEYSAILEDYNLKYTESDIAFLLYRGIITAEELDTYFKGSKKTEAMPRYEAAILITKAMLAEEKATEEVLFDMDYSDAKEIPGEAKQYVYFVTQKGIMSGTGTGKFEPNTPVQRGQVAVMLSKTANSTNYNFEVAKLEEVDTSANNIKIEDYDDQIGYNKDTVVFSEGEEVSDKKLFAGQTVVLTYAEDDEGVKVVYIDILKAEVTEKIKTIYKGYTSNAGKLFVNVEDPVTGDTTQYTCSPNAIIKIDGEALNINKIKAGEYVELGLGGEIVLEITSLEKTETIKDATLKTIDPKGAIVISHEDKKYDGMKFDLGGSVKIVRNSDSADFADLYKGDILTIKIEYGVLASVNAKSSKKVVKGILKSYTISENPTLTVSVNGKEEVYNIPVDVKIILEGNEAKLADLDIGSGIEINLESDAVKKIQTADDVVTNLGTKLSGQVVSVNTAAKVILITYMDGDKEVSQYITCKDTTKFIVMPSFGDYSLKKVKEGDKVEAYGAYQNGIFICTGMTVIPAN